MSVFATYPMQCKVSQTRVIDGAFWVEVEFRIGSPTPELLATQEFKIASLDQEAKVHLRNQIISLAKRLRARRDQQEDLDIEFLNKTITVQP